MAEPVERVTLSFATAETLWSARGCADVDGNFTTGPMDHVRLNVLLRKGLVVNRGWHAWQLTERGYTVAIDLTPKRPAGVSR